MGYHRRTRILERHLLKNQSCVYHVVNRVALGSMLLDDRAKGVFVQMMRRQAGFAGVEVMAFCVMTNHFHLLVRVPEPCEISDEELLRRYRILYGKHCPQSMPQPDYLEQMLAEGDEDAEEWRKRIVARMHDLSAFVGELKHRFSIWFNDHRHNKGTVWSERFRSIIVEDLPEYTAPVAAYIDLNPVRAQLVDDPGEYVYSSYGSAMKGVRSAQFGLRSLYSGKRTWKVALESYRVLLFGKGYESKGTPHEDTGMIDPERAYQVIKDGGRLSWAEYLRMRVGYFTRGGALGSSEFIKGFHRGGLPPKSDSPSGQGHRAKGVSDQFYTFRNIQKNVFG
ncbi:MAG: transposase [Opitutales bacterium]